MSVFTQGIKSALTKMGHRRSRSSRSDATSAADHAERETAVHDIDNYPDEEHSVEQSPAVSASSSPQPHAREYGRRGNDDDSDNDGDDNNDNCGGRDRSSPPPQRLAPRDTYGNSRAESDSLRPSSARGLPLGLRDFQQHSTNTITEVSEETTDSASWPRQPKSMFSGASKSRQPAASTNGSTTPQPTPGRGTSASIVKGAPQTNVVQVAPGNTRPASRGGRSTQGTGDDMNSFDVTELSEISASLEITSFSDMENADLVQKFKANVQPPSSDEDATARDRGGRGGTAPGGSGGNGWTDRSPGPERKASSAPAPAVSRPAVIRVAANQSDDESPWDDDEEPTRSQRQPEREADSKPRGSTTAAQQPRLAEEDEFDFDDSELDMEHA
ncbi:uncharacterized protein BJ171DRAFT_297098 [Polychytrium aggregatum]|uniref:uncharacterized protein n=1 Tax=Polychytrium aggregatum TaxID=110093 RepID=UPI0022FE92BC|nr:uncharacterized protein BJ171DRAFT_297098 [Polychytrium aggregatum]KAI9207400.1 hypothetical protein BJ171DRAFT_297098 [Polychytrium aggregatum]